MMAILAIWQTTVAQNFTPEEQPMIVGALRWASDLPSDADGSSALD
jgi:hypothetical protein